MASLNPGTRPPADSDDALARTVRRARPAVPPLPANFAAQVWAEAARQGLTPLPVWRVRGALWLGRSLAVAVLAAAVLALDAAVFELRSNGALEVLYFGVRLLDGFLAALPWDLLMAVAVTGTAGGWLLRHARIVRVPLTWAVLLAYGMTGTGGLALAASGLNERVRDAVLADALTVAARPAAAGTGAGGAAEVAGEAGPVPAPRGPGHPMGRMAGYVAGYFMERTVYQRPHAHFRMGRVLTVQGERVRLQAPDGQELEAQLPPGFQAKVGEHLRLIVAEDAPVLRVEQAQRCAPAAQRYFHPMRRMHGPGGGPGLMRPGMGPGMMGPGMMRPSGAGHGPHGRMLPPPLPVR